MRELLPVLALSFAVGLGSTLAVLWFDLRRRRAHRSRCQYCHHRYRPDESLACLSDVYCGESCEVAALEKMITAIRR